MKLKTNILKVAVATIISIFFLINNANKVEASEEYVLNKEAQELVEEAIHINPSIENYIENTIEMFNEEQNVSNDEFNDVIIESLENSIEISIKSEHALEDKKIELAKLNESSIDTENYQENRQIIIPNPIRDARAAYGLGISLVDAYGHKQTARYMEHAIVPIGESADSWTPRPYISHNDDWARRVATYEGLNMDFLSEFEDKVYNQELEHFTITDSYTYTAGEFHTALNTVDYSVTFTKNDVGYKASYFISDLYDFEWTEMGYDNIAVDFANNYAYAMQDLGQIKPFLISISYVN